jgi:hypothetical protein
MRWMLSHLPLVLALAMAGIACQQTADGSPAFRTRTLRSAKAITITRADAGRTIHLVVGATLILRLGPEEGWTIYIGNKRILAPSPRKALRSGTQGIYSARAVGWTELVATAMPPCTKHRPPCAIMAVGFQVLIYVDPVR